MARMVSEKNFLLNFTIAKEDRALRNLLMSTNRVKKKKKKPEEKWKHEKKVDGIGTGMGGRAGKTGMQFRIFQDLVKLYLLLVAYI